MKSNKPVITAVLMLSVIVFLTTLNPPNVKAVNPPLRTIIDLSAHPSSGGTVSLTGEILYLDDSDVSHDLSSCGTVAHDIQGTVSWAPGVTLFTTDSDSEGNFNFLGSVPVQNPGNYVITVNYYAIGSSGPDTCNIGGTLRALNTQVNNTSPVFVGVVLSATTSPTGVSITPGNSASATITITTNILSPQLQLSVTNCPQGWGCAFSNPSGSFPTYDSTISVSVPTSAQTGSSQSLTILVTLAAQSSSTQTSLWMTVNSLVAKTVNTLINGNAQYDGQTLEVSGTVEYLSARDNSWHSLMNAQIHVGNPQQGLGAPSWLGYSSPSDSSGYFDFSTQTTLNPGSYSLWLSLTGSNVPSISDATYSYTFSDSNATVSLYYALTITLTSDTYTINTVPSGASNVATISVSTNSPIAYPVTLSAKCPSSILDVCQLSTTSLSPSTSPLTSKLTVHVPNSTSPGTYKITVTASTSVGNYPISQSIQISVIVQKNTRSLVITIQGLPSGIQTSLQLDNGMSYTLGSGTQTITVRNGTQLIQTTQEIDSASGDTRYICNNNQQSTTDPSVSTFTFTYVTQYRLRVTASSLPAIKGMKLMLTVNGANASKLFDPTVGFTDYYPVNTIVAFTLTPSYVATNTLDYNFTAWTDSSGKVLTPPYTVTIMKPYAVDASYTQWVEVALSTDLPSNMSSTVQMTTPDGSTSLISLLGGAQYPAGLFSPGSNFQCSVPQNQTTLYGPNGSNGNVRYVYQLMMPATPLALNKHTTILIHYETQYKIQVASPLPNTVVQPNGGTLWAAVGSNVTVQVKGSAQDSNWIPYVFSSWTGLPQASNETSASFIVSGPMTVGVQWKPNWFYILIMVGAVAGVTIPGSLLGRRKIMGWREGRGRKTKKVPEEGDLEEPAQVTKRKFEQLPTADNEQDMKLYNYIIEKGGSISIPNAMKELNMTREELTTSIGRIKEKGLLG